MIFLLFAIALPSVFWDKGPETAELLRKAGINRVAVPSGVEGAWKQQDGLTVIAADPKSAIKLNKPGVQMRVNQASATRSPWLDLNAGLLLRNPRAKFYYQAPGASAAVAAAEAYIYGVDATIATDENGLQPLGDMLRFLGGLKRTDLPPVADIGFIDDGSPQASEVMNLMARRNLLFRIVPAPDAQLPLNVAFGSEKYPKSGAANPSEFTQKIRYDLTDERRSMRLYGSEVVIARLASDGRKARVDVLNYAAGSRSLYGIRVRVRGSFKQYEVRAFGIPDVQLVDFEAGKEATEFTIPELKTFAVIELAR